MAYQGVNPFPFQGLSRNEVVRSRDASGRNMIGHNRRSTFLIKIRSVFGEPMVLILLTVIVIYFLLGQRNEAAFMFVALLFILAISFFQDSRSDRALEALRERNAPWATVIRSNQLHRIMADEVVLGDLLVAEEGGVLAADGEIIRCNDFSVDESALTGESLSVKKELEGDRLARSGTFPLSGLAVVRVTAIGEKTEFGKIERSLGGITSTKTPLQRQLNRFVAQMGIIGAAIFLLVWAISWAGLHDLLHSLLRALTLAMSVVPEEIPVAFSVFMAIGAWRLMQKKVIVKDTRVVEALGAATVICVDKTGTITQNRMKLAEVFVPGIPPAGEPVWSTDPAFTRLLSTAMWASERVPFDPMEKALHEAYTLVATNDERENYQMVFEYPLAGKPPMMTHIFENASGQRIIAAKGAPEAILKLLRLDAPSRREIETELERSLKNGYRVLAVASSDFEGDDFPTDQTMFPFVFCGLVSFSDPVKPHIAQVFRKFEKAGIAVKMITGDHLATAMNVARLAGITVTGKAVTGDEIARMTDEKLAFVAQNTEIFARMFPDAKLRVIRVLKEAGHVVAMTGDGVNDAPALKLADIGIAMGKRGTEVARQSASLVLLDDDLNHMVEAIASGRRIYANLKKTIHYIIGIHLPIVLAISLPLLAGWKFPALFTPMHVIFLELLMGSTCALVYENEPLERQQMAAAPRRSSASFLSTKELFSSLIQGLLIAAGTLTVAYSYISAGSELPVVTTATFSTLLSANFAFTLCNGIRTQAGDILENKALGVVAGFSLMSGIGIFAIPPIRTLFGLTTLSPEGYATTLLFGMLLGSIIAVRRLFAR